MNRQEVYALIEQHYRDNYEDTVKKLSGHTGSSYNAEDIVQTAYMRACEYWNTYDPEQDMNAWIRTIINNSMKDFFRAEILQGMTEGPPNHDGISSAAFHSLELEELLKHIEGKPFGIKRILRMYLIDGYDSQEISKIVPENPANIRKIVERFRNEIQEVFG